MLGNNCGELECQILTKIFDINILILKYENFIYKDENEDLNQNNQAAYYSFYEYFAEFNKTKYIPLCILKYN